MCLLQKTLHFRFGLETFFVARWWSKWLQGAKEYLWGPRRMHNEARPFVNPQRISSWLLTDCMGTFEFWPKLVSFVCVTKKLTFLASCSHWQDLLPPNSSWNFGWSAFCRRKRFALFCSRRFANHSKSVLKRHLSKSNANQKWPRNFTSCGELHDNAIGCALGPTNGMKTLSKTFSVWCTQS